MRIRTSQVVWYCLACVMMALCTPDRGFADEPAMLSTAPSQSTDVGDLWRWFRHKDQQPDRSSAAVSEKHVLVITPTVTSKPSTGLTGGISTSLAFVRGDPDTTHLSSVTANAKLSKKGQATSSVRFGTFSSGDSWYIEGDNRFQWTSLDIYGSGLTTSPAHANLKYDWFRVYETVYRRVASRLFVGVGLNLNDHTNIRPTADLVGSVPIEYFDYSEKHQFETSHQVSSGTSAGVLFDTRDNAINSQRGWLARGTYRTFFDGFIGGNSSWQEVNLDVRTYRKLTPDARRKLAFWFLGDLVTGGTAPYLDLPATSGDMYGRAARGYAEGRYRGPHMLYGEIEYRATLVPSGLVGMVAFLNATTLDGEAPGQDLFKSVAPGAGLGLRVLLNKRSRTNLCADYGVGRQGSRGFYLAIQEAF